MDIKGERYEDSEHVNYTSLPVLLSKVPHGLKEINSYYGIALDEEGKEKKGFREAYLSSFSIPFPMRLAWNKAVSVSRITCHKKIGDALVDALKEIQDYKGYEYLRQNNLELFGGCYNPRPKTGGTEPSTHAWGIAIDINPDLGRFGKVSQMPKFIIDAFVKRGFEYGGLWKIPDGMHFQACTGY